MKPAVPQPEKNFARDVKTFERLPAKTKELARLQDQAEKATGRERVVLNQSIRAKAK